MTNEQLVRASGLGRRFGAAWALAHVQLEVSAGDLLILAGANGSGKTTLLRLLCGLTRRTEGTLEVFGLDPSQHPLECRQRTTLITHHGYLYSELTAYEMLDLWNRLLPQPHAAETLEATLVDVGLESARDRPVRTYSAGMRKRLTLTRARLEQPELLLLDEPFAALDPPGQELVARWILEHRGRGGTVVMASHALERASRLGGRALLLERGQIVWRGDSGELGARYR